MMRARCVLLCLAVLGSSSAAMASDYYVSLAGSDTNPGTLALPFRTIQKAASAMVAGDTAHIRAGVYREGVRPAVSGGAGAPIRFQPYNGERVTVSGADLVPPSFWSAGSDGSYQAAVTWNLGDGANQVFMDGRMMIEARWPNTTLDVSHPTVALTGDASYVWSGSGLATGTITGLNLPSRPDGYWNGARININVFKPTQTETPGPGWSWQTGTVLTHSATTLSFTWSPWVIPDGILPPGPANPYFLTGRLTELDAGGEWFLEAGTLHFRTSGGDSPAGHTVEVKRRRLAFDLTGRSFVEVRGLNIFAATIASDASEYLVFDGLTVEYSSHFTVSPGNRTGATNSGLILSGSNNVLRHSTIAFSAGNGVALIGSGHRVFNNVVRDANYVGNALAGIAAATLVPSRDFLIAWNTVYDTGAAGITHHLSSRNRILHNEVYNYALQVSDIGCIYDLLTDGGGTEIAYNLCHDSRANLANGVYLDFGSSNFVVHHNVVWGSWGALALNSVSRNNKIYNNTLVADTASVRASGQGGPAEGPETELKNNIYTGRLAAIAGIVTQNNLQSTSDPQFVDRGQANFQLRPGSPAIDAGVAIPRYTDGFSGRAPDIGAYEVGVTPWKAGAGRGVAVIEPNSPSAPYLLPGAVALGTLPAPAPPTGTTVKITDGAGRDFGAQVVNILDAQITFVIPTDVAPGVALVTVTAGDGSIFLGSAPVFSDR